MRAAHDVGETLVEILLTIVITSLTVTALISSLATAGNAGNVQRNSVRADIVMRNYAEATKAAARSCLVPGDEYTVVYTAPAGFSATVEQADGVGSCPSLDLPLTVTLVVTGPMGLSDSMDLTVRTP